MTSKRPATSPQNSGRSAKKKSRLPFELTTERIIIGGSVLLTIIIVAVIGFSSARNGANRTASIEGVEIFTGLVPEHVTTPITYDQIPPVGGSHNPVWQTCGVYTEQIANEHAVHSLEHGAVWITYQPELPADQVQTLQNITRQGTHRLLSPYPGIDSPVIVTAWGYQLKLESADDGRLMQFISKYEQGPSTPELGASCSGGETRTLNQILLGVTMARIENLNLPAVEPETDPRATNRLRSVLIILWVMGLFVLLWVVYNQGNSIGEGSPEAGFSRDMIVHHAQAVEMALLLYDRTENPTLRSIALDILLSQQTQIGQMEGWLYLWQLPIAGSDLPMTWMGTGVKGLMPGMATDEQMAALRESTGVEADRQFIDLMIPHHQAGIHMAEMIQGQTSVPAVQDFARSVVETQQREIIELEKERAKIS